MPRRVFITVAEVSGDKIAAGLIRELKRLEPDIVIEGIGGPAMAQAGAVIHRDMTQRAAMTFHAIARAKEVWQLLRWTREHYQLNRPDLHVCVDSSGMNLHFAKSAKRAGIPVLYYVAPQVWASRERRIKKIRKCVDRLACIFPFEEMYFRSRGVEATFVGHPLFDSLPPGRLAHLKPLRSANVPPVVGIVPGSRRAEIRENLPHLLDVVNQIRLKFPGVQFLIPTTSAVDQLVREMARNAPDMRIELNVFDQLIPQCDLCLTKSGTSTVHVAAWGIPMIVVYRIHPLVWHLFGRWVIKTRKIAMVNILAGQIDLVPEFIPWYGSNQPVADCAIDLLGNPEKLKAQRDAIVKLLEPLDHPGASTTVAKIAIEMMNESKRTSGGAGA